MQLLELSVESGQMLSVRAVHVEEAVSKLFTVDVWALSANSDLDLEAIVGRRTELRAATGWNLSLLSGNRIWTGICSSIEQVQAEPTGLSTYRLRMSPRLWLLTQRSNYRVFQHLSIPAIIDKLLAEWSIAFRWEIDRGNYPKLEYKVQYGETDFAFFCRLLEEAGIAFTFPFEPSEGSKLVLGDKLHRGQPRGAPPIPYADNPSHTTGTKKEYISKVRLSQVVRPGAHTIRDYDFRNPSYKLLGESLRARGLESEYEQYRYEPGGFLVETSRG
jgi:type VI secretion system secreted protein VgrG